MSHTIFQFSFGDGYAGSAKVAISSSELLQKKGYKVSLFASENSLTERRAREKGIEVFALSSAKKSKELMKEIVPLFLEKKPQFVISHHSLDRKIGFNLKRKFGKNFINIGYRHNISKTTPLIGPFIYNLYYDYLIACSKGVANSLISSGIKKKKVETIYNGIEIPENINEINGNSIREKFNLYNKVVLGLSTWFHKERKGFDILFKAFSKLDHNFILLLVGIPPENQNDVINYASEFGIDKSRIVMPGYVENIWEYYKSMNIFLLTSRSEGFSLALLEAAAAKLPIIASDIPGNNELIRDGENGLLFSLNNPGELEEKILKINSDNTYADYLSSNASQLVLNNFLVQHYADNLDKFLKKVIEEKI